MNIETLFRYIFLFSFFPGFLFSAGIGLVFSWAERKVTARIQWRKGPPFLQPFYDIIKLLGKETSIPRNGNPVVFLFAPFPGMISVSIVATILWTVNLNLPVYSFVGDLIVVVSLLFFPTFSIVLGGFSSGNPFASIGARREMKLFMGYEVPFLICIATAIIKSDGSIGLETMSETPILLSISGVLCFIVVLLCFQAKLGFVPFDSAYADTEIMGGPFIEYSGPPLAIFMITRAMLLFTLPLFMITLFLGGLHFHEWEILYSVLKYVIILFFIIIIKNINPRLSIDQSVKFFWIGCGSLSCAALICAAFGKIYHVPWL